MRYYPATRRELNDLAEEHHERTRPVSPEEIEQRQADLRRALSTTAPPLSTVLIWAEDLALRPTPQQWAAAENAAGGTTLAGALRILGACDEDVWGVK